MNHNTEHRLVVNPPTSNAIVPADHSNERRLFANPPTSNAIVRSNIITPVLKRTDGSLTTASWFASTSLSSINTEVFPLKIDFLSASSSVIHLHHKLM